MGVGAVDEFAIAQFDAARRLGGDVGIVRDEGNGVAFAVKLAEEFENCFAGERVERTGRLIGENDFRFVHQRACDGDALRLTTGELTGAILYAIGKSDRVNGAQGAFAAFLAADVGVDHGQLDIFENIEPGQEVEGLKDEADLFVADAGEFIVARLADIHAVEHDGAGADIIETTENLHHGRFSAAGGSDDGDVFARLNVEGDAVERADFLIANGVGLAHIAHFNQSHDEKRELPAFDLRRTGEQNGVAFLQSRLDFGEIEIGHADLDRLAHG